MDCRWRDLIAVTSDTVDKLLPDLPRMVRLALGFGSKLQRGTLDVILPDGRTVRLGGVEPGPNAVMKLRDFGFASRLLRGGDIGIAEAYLRGEWDTPDLTQFLYLFCVNRDLSASMLSDQPLVRYVQTLRHWFNRNTKRQARRNIYAHYDIGNAFYSAWLDPSMTYSSALFEDAHAGSDLGPDQQISPACGSNRPAARPEAARDRLRLGRLCRIRRQDYGANVVGLTISKEQRDFAQAPHPQGRALPRRSRSGCRTIATSAASTTASPRSR